MPETETAPATTVPREASCTFCMKTPGQVETMVAGAGVFICNECVALCVELIEAKPKGQPQIRSWKKMLSDDELLATLPRVAAVTRQVEGELAAAVTEARARGITWTRIGAAMDMTRQSAWERFSGEE
ncbi:MAG TPA: ClpX C4-type zinc finger protein [Streptosporangiaceae bacterium]|nr:ClpX C4-type zinc finger protein [Streptosporangiaceae bacterium]